MANEDYEKFMENFRRMMEAMAEAQKGMAEAIRPMLELAEAAGGLGNRIEQAMRPWIEQQQAIAEMIRRLLGPFEGKGKDKEEE